MNYRHAFHAGNFADVHKHVVLLMLLEHLHKKPASFFVLDTHAGRGSYDLRSPEAQRGDEWRHGIGRLMQATPSTPVLRRYLTMTTSDPHAYPGSPLIVTAMLREEDRAVFVEQQPEEANALKKVLNRRPRVSVFVQDGYAALKAQLPPKENRGLVLIDPPYERETEFADVARALQLALNRWTNGIYCVWFPIKPGGAEQRWLRTLLDSGLKRLLVATLNIRPPDSPLGLSGSGLLIVNPPWQLDAQLRSTLPDLHKILATDGAGGVHIESIAGE
jgi:23S rRNA (adenine2030-N6)-methyltransferase